MKKVKAFCAFADCGKPAMARGLCAGHWTQDKRGIPLAPLRHRERRPSCCQAPGCNRPVMARGFCSAHYQQKKLGRDLVPIRDYALNMRTRGTGAKTKEGYIRMTVSHGSPETRERFLQHRQVMEQYLGRPLYRDESVHHRNGDRADNRIENLELWSKSHPPGQRVADKLAWAHEIIKRYGDLVDLAVARPKLRVIK